jgi:hypothetical protein
MLPDSLFKPLDLDDALEKAFWRFDALHKAHYRDVEPGLPGPLSEREAFKRAVSGVVRGACSETARPALVDVLLVAATDVVDAIRRDERLDDDLEALCKAVDAIRAPPTGGTE